MTNVRLIDNFILRPTTLSYGITIMNYPVTSIYRAAEKIPRKYLSVRRSQQREQRGMLRW